MKILLLSDSHGKKGVLKQVIKAHRDADMLIHLGDYTTDADLAAKLFGKETVVVAGNGDYGSNYPTDRLLTLGQASTKCLLTHGHKYRVKWGLTRLKLAAMEKRVDVVLFGHTHIPMVEYDRLLFVNPGSLYSGSYGLLRLDGGMPNASIHHVRDIR